MNRDSNNTSQDSLELKQNQDEIEWKKKENDRNVDNDSTSSEEDEEEIEISGEKVKACVKGGGGKQSTMSKTESVARDVRRLKSATLDRMGRMLKIHSKSSSEKPDTMPVSTAGGEELTRKQKFNSLTRMLTPSDSKRQSLNRILRKKVPVEGDTSADKPDENTKGIFSKIIGQIRSVVSRTNNTAENTSLKIKEKSTPETPSNLVLSNVEFESS